MSPASHSQDASDGWLAFAAPRPQIKIWGHSPTTSVCSGAIQATTTATERSLESLSWLRRGIFLLLLSRLLAGFAFSDFSSS